MELGIPLSTVKPEAVSRPNLRMNRRLFGRGLVCATIAAAVLPLPARAQQTAYGNGSGGQLLSVNGQMLPRDIVFRFLPVLLPIASLHVTSLYGLRRDPIKGYTAMHPGVDFADVLGTPAFSTAVGRVVHAGPSGSYGNMIEVAHGLGYSTRYAHLSGYTVSEGQMVDRQQQIGMVGNTGYSTGTHLHFEIRKNGETINPIEFLIKARELYHHFD